MANLGRLAFSAVVGASALSFLAGCDPVARAPTGPLKNCGQFSAPMATRSPAPVTFFCTLGSGKLATKVIVEPYQANAPAKLVATLGKSSGQGTEVPYFEQIILKNTKLNSSNGDIDFSAFPGITEVDLTFVIDQSGALALPNTTWESTPDKSIWAKQKTTCNSSEVPDRNDWPSGFSPRTQNGNNLMFSLQVPTNAVPNSCYEYDLHGLQTDSVGGHSMGISIDPQIIYHP